MATHPRRHSSCCLQVLTKAGSDLHFDWYVMLLKWSPLHGDDNILDYHSLSGNIS
jgi:hypothetical protein